VRFDRQRRQRRWRRRWRKRREKELRDVRRVPCDSGRAPGALQSDWHRHNLKLKLANQPAVTEAEFAIDATGFF
jgi:hypothetical protein